MKSEILLAYCTFPDNTTAESICRILVQDGTIACANILAGHTAIYSWQGTLHSEAEVGAILKLNARKRKALEERIRGTHPYSVPALVFLKTDGGLPEFLSWVCGQSL